MKDLLDGCLLKFLIALLIQNSDHFMEIGASFPARVDFAVYGCIVEQSPNRIQLKVKRESAIAVCKELLDAPVNDILTFRSPHRRSHPPDFCP